MDDLGIKKWKKWLYADFKKRYEEYSKLGWKNKKWLSWVNIDSVVPAFTIRLVSDKAIAKIKKFTDIYDEIQKMNIVFQYIKYRPKKAATESASKYLAKAKYDFNWKKWEAQRKWINTAGRRSPTSESLWIKAWKETFVNTYLKILYRKADGTKDVIKSDWTGYLVTMIRENHTDIEVMWQDYFFKVPATIRSTQKQEIDEKIFKKVSKILDEIEDIITQFEYGDTDMYEVYKWTIIRLANSLTIEGLDLLVQEKLNKEQEEELRKKMIVWDEFDYNENEVSQNTKEINWDNLEDNKDYEEEKRKNEKKLFEEEKQSWDSFEEDTEIKKEKEDSFETEINKISKDKEEVDWDALNF